MTFPHIVPVTIRGSVGENLEERVAGKRDARRET
jgi:hypothetical protein